MGAVQGSTQGSGTGNPDTGNSNDGKIRNFEAVIILLVAVVAGMASGIAKRMMDHSSYFEAIVAGIVVGFALPGFIIMIIMYIRNQS
jgi:phosphate starvation-inducible membrane PsiE